MRCEGCSTIDYLKMEGRTANLDMLAQAQVVKEGKLKPVVGRVAKLSDLEAVRSGC